ncbi:porin [Marinobacter litoralis]|uniref:porin n=1 Tax=Marinobacter litoralis TaxID=187981 RepID=UPI0018EA698A|nr:porin [Marinobacter litoralis]MBJ6138742.1 porin [Marinobacter litoralis]
MKKTILASAIAAATFSGAAMAQEINLPVVYGNIQYALTYTDAETKAGTSSHGLEHFDNGTTLGVAHDHEIAPGITGFFKLEVDGFGADNKGAKKDIIKLDEAYVGVKGDNFGQVWVGSDDSMYETSVDEIGEFWEVGSGIGNDYDTGEGDLVQYLSPNFGGLKLGAAVQINGDKDPLNGGKKSFPWQLAAMYNVDALELAFAVDSNDGAGNNENSYGLRASFNLEDLRLTGQFETRKDVADTFGVMGVYTLGANQFALGYQLVDEDSGDKEDVISLQALHNLSDHMYVYVEGYVSSADEDKVYDVGNGAFTGDERSTIALGAVYYF